MMFPKMMTALAVLFLMGSALTGCAPLASAATPGSGPDSALPIPPGTVTLAPGQRIWYGFQYAGDDSQILIDMRAEPGGSANFSVWTAGDVRNWQNGGGENPVGRGSPQTTTRRQADGSVEEASLYGGNLIWSGSFRSPGTYYVVVDQAGPDPAQINLKVTGSGVSAIPGPPVQAATPVVTPAQAKPAPAAAACTPVPVLNLSAGGPGSSPDQALPLPPVNTYLLPVSQRAWYAFHYSGDGSQILLDLRAVPQNSAGFSVYTPGNTTTPVGRGNQQTTNRRSASGAIEETKLYGGDLVWSGNFPSPGTYYVAVDQTGGSPSTITLGINSKGVSGSTAGTLPSNIPPGPACVPQPTATPATTTLSTGGPGSSPSQALPLLPVRSYLLPVGQRTWYAFRYSGDESQILLELRATPDNSANFAVYTPGDTSTPVGRGSQQTTRRRQADGSVEETKLYGGNLIWSGNFRSPGTYYVAVEQTGPNPSTITLMATGTGVSAP